MRLRNICSASVADGIERLGGTKLAVLRFPLRNRNRRHGQGREQDGNGSGGTDDAHGVPVIAYTA